MYLKWKAYWCVHEYRRFLKVISPASNIQTQNAISKFEHYTNTTRKILRLYKAINGWTDWTLLAPCSIPNRVKEDMADMGLIRGICGGSSFLPSCSGKLITGLQETRREDIEQAIAQHTPKRNVLRIELTRTERTADRFSFGTNECTFVGSSRMEALSESVISSDSIRLISIRLNKALETGTEIVLHGLISGYLIEGREVLTIQAMNRGMSVRWRLSDPSRPVICDKGRGLRASKILLRSPKAPHIRFSSPGRFLR